MELHVLAQGKNDPPKLEGIKQPVVDLSMVDSITMCVCEGGMQSGEPSVIIVTQDNEGSVVIQTSLDKLIAGVSSVITLAETRWGWVRPEGHATLMPPDRATQKALLEAIKKELEEWEET